MTATHREGMPVTGFCGHLTGMAGLFWNLEGR